MRLWYIPWYISDMRKTAKLFKNGRSQAVRLPAEFRFEGDEVLIERRGNEVVLAPKKKDWHSFFSRKSRVPADFMDDVDDPPPEERDIF